MSKDKPREGKESAIVATVITDLEGPSGRVRLITPTAEFVIDHGRLLVASEVEDYDKKVRQELIALTNHKSGEYRVQFYESK